MPPPLPAELSEMVLPMTNREPIFMMPPPSLLDELPEIVLSVMRNVPKLLKMPPPVLGKTVYRGRRVARDLGAVKHESALFVVNATAQPTPIADRHPRNGDVRAGARNDTEVTSGPAARDRELLGVRFPPA